MKKHCLSSRLLAFLLMIAIALSMLPSVTVFAATGTLTRNTAVRHVVCEQLSTKAKAYYTGSNVYESLSQLSGVSAPTNSYTATQNNPLYTALQTLMTDTQQKISEYNPSGETNTELSYLWDYTDASAGSNEYLYFYTDIPADDYGTSELQREHIWPRSRASFDYLNGGADLHHLRPSIGTVNSAKSDHRFANVRNNYSTYSTTTIDGKDVIWVNANSGVLEVRDNVKGDIARILLYVYCRWAQPNLYSDVSNSYLPPFDEDDTSNNGKRMIENFDTLLEWMEMDPVDNWEMTRNDQTENYQGNRNVFIDYPEFAWLMFNETPPTTMKTPSGKAASGSSAPAYAITAISSNTNYGTVTLNGNVITATPKSGYEVSGYTLMSGTATVAQNGNVFTVNASSDCKIRINFRAITYTITAYANNSAYGSVSVNGYTITATPNEGYQVSGYTLISGSATVSRNGNIFTLTPKANSTVQINFSPIAFNITATPNYTSYGSVTVDGYTVTATPKAGYEVVGYELLSGSATVVQNGNVFTLTPTSDCNIQINFAKIVYALSATTNSNAYGTVSIDGYIITAIPNDGYIANGYTIVSGTATVVQDGNTFTVTPTSDCVIRINFVSLTGCTIDFITPDGVSQNPISGYDGETITLPTPTGTPKADAYDYTFLGWTTSEVNNATNEPTILKAGQSYILHENVTLYALYTYAIGATNETHYTRVTDTSKLKDGAQVVIAAQDSSYAIATTQSSSSRSAASITKNTSNDTITFSGSVCVFTLRPGTKSDTWAFYDSTNNGYIYASSSKSNAMNTQATINDNSSFTITFSTDGAIITAQGANTMNTIGFYGFSFFYAYFTCYSATSSSRGPVDLYMMTSVGTTYYTTVLESVCEHDFVEDKRIEPDCTTAGKATFKCTLCGESYDEELPALGHSYSYTSTVAPTESEQGYDIYTCSDCGLTMNQNYTQPTGYNYRVDFVVPEGVTAPASITSNSITGATLPSLNGKPTNDENNAQFIGWSAVKIDHSDKETTYYAAGSKFTATGNTTLYALYSYKVSSGVCDPFVYGESGKFVLAAVMNGTYYAIPNSFTLSSGMIYPTVITVENGEVTDPNAANFEVILTYYTSGYYTISNGSKYLAYSGSSTSFAEAATTAYNWQISTGTRGTWRISETSTTGTPRAIAYYNLSTSAPRFGVYSASNLTSSSTLFYEMEILPISGMGATTYYTTSFEICEHKTTEAIRLEATCTKPGSITYICTNCKDVVSTETIPTAEHSFTYTNNDEDHTIGCANCNYSVTEPHTYEDGNCICGATEVVEPTEEYVETLKPSMSIVVGAEMSVAFTVNQSMVSKYESFYLVVEKDMVGAEPKTVTFGYGEGQTALTPMPNATNPFLHNASFTGLTAKEMGDEIRATLYCADAEGNIFYGPTQTDSVKDYLMRGLDLATSTDAKKTMYVDMLRYGAVAQTYFDYDTDNLVTDDLTEEHLTYATTEIPEAVDASKAEGGLGTLNTSVVLKARVTLTLSHLKPGANLANMKFVVKDALDGTVIKELPAYNLNPVMVAADFDDVGAKQMRRLITVTLYDGNTAITDTVTWSVESYVAKIRATSTDAGQIDLVNAMLTYGDAVAAYMATQ